MNLENLPGYSSEYLNGQDIGQAPVNLTVKTFELRTIGEDQKIVLGLQETNKEFRLNKTQFQALSAMFGLNSDDWIGKQFGAYGEVLAAGQFAGKWTIKILPALASAPAANLPAAEERPGEIAF